MRGKLIYSNAHKTITTTHLKPTRRTPTRARSMSIHHVTTAKNPTILNFNYTELEKVKDNGEESKY